MEIVGVGGKVPVPVTLAANPMETKVSRISMEVSFPATPLIFREAAKGSALESFEAKIQTAIKDAENGDKVLQLDVSAPQALPQGTLVNLSFEISQGAKPDVEIKLKNLKPAAIGTDGKPLDTYGIDGSITVMPPAAACFFYMH